MSPFKVTIPRDLHDEARGAVAELSRKDPNTFFSLNVLVETALVNELKKARKKYNGGQPFDPVETLTRSR
jgi:hypothetical protein